MKKPGDGDGGGGKSEFGGGGPGRPGNARAASKVTPGRAAYICAGLAALSFFIHMAILFLVEPLRVLALDKFSAYAVSSIPLCFGVIFALSVLYNFIRIEARSASHFVALMAAFIFGSLSLQGLAGFVLYAVRHSQDL